MRADAIFEKLGYTKICETESNVLYERDRVYGKQIIELMYKNEQTKLGHLIFSYEEALNADGFNNVVGVNIKTIMAARKKMREKGWITFFGKDKYFLH